MSNRPLSFGPHHLTRTTSPAPLDKISWRPTDEQQEPRQPKFWLPTWATAAEVANNVGEAIS